MNQRRYFDKVYSKYWQEKVQKYGFTAYETYIVKNIMKSHPKGVFAVGIGTGWPIEDAMCKKDKKITISGCDVASSSVRIAQEQVGCHAGLIYCGTIFNYLEKDKFDVVYCVRTSWYIPNFYKTLEKMISMTKDGGMLVFDIMDNRSLYHLKVILMWLWKWLLFFLGVNYQKPDKSNQLKFYSKGEIEKILKERGLHFNSVGERKIHGGIDVFNTPKIVYVCRLK